VRTPFNTTGYSVTASKKARAQALADLTAFYGKKQVVSFLSTVKRALGAHAKIVERDL
jgi:hypothetical protein